VDYRQLGNTALQVSTIALGCWAFAGDANWGAQDDSASLATVRAALDLGINLFDTAEAYGAGRSEAVLGAALRGRRQQAIIATKASPDHLASPLLEQACERSLVNLQTDYIDLYQVHWPSRTVPMGETVATLERLRQQGKIRFVGVCNYGPRDLAELQAKGRAESNQLPYSLLWRAIEHEILPRCVASHMGLLAYMPLMQGLLTGKFATADDVPTSRARTRHFSSARPDTRHGEPGCEAETFSAIERIRGISARLGQHMGNVSLAWVLQQPGVTSALVGARRPEQVLENAQAVGLRLPAEALAELSQATAELRRILGPNPDLYQGSAGSRYR
jgi:myo-inositol catabolism protein IolS